MPREPEYVKGDDVENPEDIADTFCSGALSSFARVLRNRLSRFVPDILFFFRNVDSIHASWVCKY